MGRLRSLCLLLWLIRRSRTRKSESGRTGEVGIGGVGERETICGLGLLRLRVRLRLTLLILLGLGRDVSRTAEGDLTGGQSERHGDGQRPTRKITTVGKCSWGSKREVRRDPRVLIYL